MRVACVLPLLMLIAGCGSQPQEQVAPVPSEPVPVAASGTSSEGVPHPGSSTKDDLARAIELSRPGEGPNQLAREQIEAGWIRLFDGATLFGWKANNDVNWSVADGEITADSGEPGLLLTTTEFVDYELLCDFHLEEGGNSGIFLRTNFEAQNPATDAYELNICDTHEAFPTGSIVARQKADKDVTSEGTWKSFRVRVEGNRIRAELDGEAVIDFTDESDAPRPVGYVGLQKNAGRVRFRNVFLRPLAAEPLFNGQDLSGWRKVPGSKSEFSVEDGAIHVAGGPGFLETEEVWGDFLLQASVLTRGEHLNSGIFLRTIPGTEKAPSNGYELQIQHGYKQEDRTQPMDYGTGAIMHRVPVRFLAAEDNEWAVLTLVASGPHFTTWVNGTQMIDWTDERAPDENPRRGLRTEAGHISLQGHDAATDVLFRDVRVRAYP